MIGIDVAPAKGGHVYEHGATPRLMKPADLDSYLCALPGDVLVAWDAPLTGPPDPATWTGGRDLTTRPIESFFTRHGRYKAPPGISVRSYCGCPHWTISRRLLGLPRIGRYDKTELPFRLVTDDLPPRYGRHVVEVHPAVALWLWCKEDGYNGPWKYKGDAKAKVCRTALCVRMSMRMGKDLTGISDDELDSMVAWYLAHCWVNRQGVRLLGNERTGSFLLPDEPNLRTEFEQFAPEK